MIDDFDTHATHAPVTLTLGLILVLPVVAAAVAYVASAVIEIRSKKRGWPIYRVALWLLGLMVVALTLVGPLAERSHTDFFAHMATHLMVGMLAPLLLVCAAPLTLALRTLSVDPARRLSRLLKSWPLRFLTHPIPAAAINIGSLWFVYASPLSSMMFSNPLFHYFLLIHFFIAGYLFTASLVSVDPTPHPVGFPLRTAVLLVAIAGHSILAKYIYAHPPQGTTAISAEPGGVLMYYGGDLLELALLVVFFTQWYRAAGRRLLSSAPGARLQASPRPAL
ncbi:MAG TPA: cytochrome c oxidase assembly protein [Glaciihabitans sp.]|nr:cytochrome c oxidase assembly protein [Glaciihabitans sp.]